MENEKFYEIHRSDAIKILLTQEKYPMQHSNLTLAELLEEHFPEKNRNYIVKEDNLELNNPLTAKTF